MSYLAPQDQPDHFIHFRWGAFQLYLSGRGPMIAWFALLTAAVAGFKILRLLEFL